MASRLILSIPPLVRAPVLGWPLARCNKSATSEKYTHNQFRDWRRHRAFRIPVIAARNAGSSFSASPCSATHITRAHALPRQCLPGPSRTQTKDGGPISGDRLAELDAVAHRLGFAGQ